VISGQRNARTILAGNQPPIVLHVCVCCLSCGTVLAPTSEPVALCKTCGEPCSCPGCRAGHPPNMFTDPPGRAA
jgi:hypothetical protein